MMKNLIVLLTTILISLSVFSQKPYYLYFNYNKNSTFSSNNELFNSYQVYFIECDDDLIFVHNHYIEIESYESYCEFYFDNELVGQFLTKRWVNQDHLIIYFIESKTYYYFHNGSY